jgi:hypothetical protein
MNRATQFHATLYAAVDARRQARRYVLAVLLGFVLATVVASVAQAQGAAKNPYQPHPGNPPLLIFADTAGIVGAGQDVYATWIFSRVSPTSFPSSGILVAFDCWTHRVRRLAQVVYHWNSDSTGVVGQIEEHDGQWVAPTIPKLFDMVCEIGPTHAPSMVEPTVPDSAQADGMLRVS